MYKPKNKHGAITLILVLVMSVLIVFLTAGWQSRLLLSLHRSQALSDILVLTYHAESRIYDIVAKFLGGYPNAFNFPFNTTETLTDGTVLSTSGNENGRQTTLTVGAKRLFGSAKLELLREDKSTTDKFFQDTEIMMSLDCTGSMGDPACPTCVNSRMDELKRAVLQFLDSVGNTEGHERVKIGISAFAMKADWLYTSYAGDGQPTGQAVRPDSDLSLTQIRQAVENGFGHSGEADSPACKKLLTYTSIGTGLGFMHDYLRSTAAPGVKQVEMLITDGEPNQRTPYAGCPVDTFCPGNGNYCCPAGSNCFQTGWSCTEGSGTTTCTPYGRDFLRCTLADTNTIWRSEVLGDVLGTSTGEPTSTPTPLPTPRPTPVPPPTATPTPFGAPTATPRPTSTPRPTRTPTPIGAPTNTPRPTRIPRPTTPPPPTDTPMPALYGVRDPNVDVYTVTVMDAPPAEVLSIFQAYSTKYYSLSEADKLTEILGQILQEILHSLTSYQIRRVVPTPIR